MQKKDLLTPDDVKLMVDSFYNKVNHDELLSPVFNDFAKVDWNHHLPKMYNFWNTILFFKGDYKGSPFDKHIPLPIEGKHFERWLSLFDQNIDEIFEGPNANEAKLRAKTIGYTFKAKLESIKK